MSKPDAAGPVLPPVIIAGAGVGGLTAALALAGRGIESIVCERAPELSEVGAGLQLSPNATRILQSIGVLEQLQLTATPVQSIELVAASQR